MVSWYENCIKAGLSVTIIEMFLNTYRYMGESSSTYIDDLYHYMYELRKPSATVNEPLQLPGAGVLTNIDLQLCHWDLIDAKKSTKYIEERFIAAKFESSYRSLKGTYIQKGHKDKTAATKALKDIKRLHPVSLPGKKVNDYWKRRKEISGRWYTIVEHYGWGGLFLFPAKSDIIPHKFWEHKSLGTNAALAFLNGLETVLPAFKEASKIFTPYVLHYFKHRSFHNAPLLDFEKLPEGITTTDRNKFLGLLKHPSRFTLDLSPDAPPIHKRSRIVQNSKSKEIISTSDEGESDEDAEYVESDKDNDGEENDEENDGEENDGENDEENDGEENDGENDEENDGEENDGENDEENDENDD